MKLDISNIILAVKNTVDSHKLEAPGEYCRWLWQNPDGTRRLGVNEYGCADALNILYTIGELICSDEERAARISVLRSMQDPKTGMFTEATHHTIHTTAHCLGALELMDARPEYPVYGLHEYMSREGLHAFLDSLDWYAPWPQSHRGAGIYAALVNSGEMTRELEDAYFEWMWENCDPECGFWKKGIAANAPYTSEDKQFGNGTPPPMYTYMAGGFHYMFNHEYASRPYRYPDKIIDTCLKMYDDVGVRENFGNTIGFLEIDWVFCLSRASRQTTHRFDEVKGALLDFSTKYIAYLNDLSAGEYKTHDRFNDLHMLFGTVCALAELQQALPGVISSPKPLRLVLDRRPFI